MGLIPRIRQIKIDVGQDEELWDLESSTGLPLYRAFTMLWCYADRAGRFEWRPRVLKGLILPYWEGDFEEVLLALTKGGFIVRYEVTAGKFVAQIRTFAKNQRPNSREPESQLPPPPENVTTTDDCAPAAKRVSVALARASDARASESPRANQHPTTNTQHPTPNTPKRSRSSRLPDDWVPTDSHRERIKHLPISLDREVEKFRAHAATHERLAKNWNAAFTQWLIQAEERLGTRVHSPQTSIDDWRMRPGKLTVEGMPE